MLQCRGWERCDSSTSCSIYFVVDINTKSNEYCLFCLSVTRTTESGTVTLGGNT
jgi:nitrate reductase beta subunit